MGLRRRHRRDQPRCDRACNGQDDDCDGTEDNGDDQITLYADLDGDGSGDDDATTLGCDAVAGLSTIGGDCNDNDDDVNPAAADQPYDDVDQDCDGADLTDVDGDGAEGGTAGDDCHDEDASIHPEAKDTPYDGVDSDCSGNDDDDNDADGHLAEAHGGDDCRDDDATIFPSAKDHWTDVGVDNNCDGSLVDRATLDLGDGVQRIDGPAA